jgi:hypothetical protein
MAGIARVHLPALSGLSSRKEKAMTNPTRPLRREEAVKYLKDTWGIDRKPQTLAQMACLGKGPVYSKDGAFALYAVEDLDRWARSIITPCTNGKGASQLSAA